MSGSRGGLSALGSDKRQSCDRPCGGDDARDQEAEPDTCEGVERDPVHHGRE
ncbi:(Na+)-NQR maturation NqrM [Streptomyces phaeochromogenes]|uniref:(Na+)-NQR maturation NqrM n=1 Tax=Streptomyces phaeochromogenes TaxID=1923 RepID=UPI00398D56C4